MKKILFALVVLSTGFTSCKKCYECSTDKSSLYEFCGEDAQERADQFKTLHASENPKCVAR